MGFRNENPVGIFSSDLLKVQECDATKASCLPKCQAHKIILRNLYSYLFVYIFPAPSFQIA